MTIEKPVLNGLRRGNAQWLKPEIRGQVQYLRAKSTFATRDGEGVAA
jgi:hypothetical protein